MQTIPSEIVFPTNQLVHNNNVPYPDGDYQLDKQVGRIITIQNHCFVRDTCQRMDGDIQVIFTFDYETMLIYREFPHDGIAKHVFDWQEIKKQLNNGWYEAMLTGVLNSSMQLENQVEKVLFDEQDKTFTAVLKEEKGSVKW